MHKTKIFYSLPVLLLLVVAGAEAQYNPLNPNRFQFKEPTLRPAELLGLKGEAGTLAAGACADLTVLRWNEEGRLRDANDVARPGRCAEPVATVRAGRLVA